MDTVIKDLKTFLKKLKSGQLDIEAGQWKLYEDMNNMKKSFEEIIKLKEDVDDMRRSNAEQQGKLRDIEGKLNKFRIRYKQGLYYDSDSSVSHAVAQNSRPLMSSSNYPMSNLNKRELPLHSEEIIEITSKISKSTIGDKPDSVVALNSSSTDKEHSEAEDSDVVTNSIIYVQSRTCPLSSSSESGTKYMRRDTKDHMLQRYLKDSAKYRQERSSCSEMYDASISSRMIPEDGGTDFHFSDDDSWIGSYQMDPTHSDRNSSPSRSRPESVLPKRFIFSKYPRKFLCKPDLLRHDRFRALNAKSMNACKVCQKVFESKDLLKAHRMVHREKSTVYKCGFCNNVYQNAQVLGVHLRRCRAAMRSRCNRLIN